MSAASPPSNAAAAPTDHAAGAACEYLTACRDWPRMREQLLQRMSENSAQPSTQEPEPPSTPKCAEPPTKHWGSPCAGSGEGSLAEQSPFSGQPGEWAGQESTGQKQAWNAAGRLPVRWRQIASAAALLLTVLLLGCCGPAWRGGVCSSKLSNLDCVSLNTY